MFPDKFQTLEALRNYQSESSQHNPWALVNLKNKKECWKIPDGPDNRIRWFKDKIPDKLLTSLFSMGMSFFSMCGNATDKSTLFVFGLHKTRTDD
jgi:hypothetical protein